MKSSSLISFTFLSYLSCLAVFVVTDHHHHPLQLHLMRKHKCFTRCWCRRNLMWFVQTQMIFWKISKDEGLPLNVIINEACICFYCISSTLTEFFRQITCYTHSQNIALAGSSENIVWRRHASESLHFVAVPKPQMFFQPSYSSKTHCLVLKSAICIFIILSFHSKSSIICQLLNCLSSLRVHFSIDVLIFLLLFNKHTNQYLSESTDTIIKYYSSKCISTHFHFTWVEISTWFLMYLSI